MDAVAAFLKNLAALPELWVEACFVRCVDRDALEGSQPPQFLHTSGKPNRYNPAGIHCIYFSENLEIAVVEFSRYLGEFPPAPFTTYFADAKLNCIDLGDADTLHTLKLARADLHASWRFSTSPTKTQLLGSAISQQNRFAAIRYPSDAARAAEKTGFNCAVFRDCIAPPSRLRIHTGGSISLQQWP